MQRVCREGLMTDLEATKDSKSTETYKLSPLCYWAEFCHVFRNKVIMKEKKTFIIFLKLNCVSRNCKKRKKECFWKSGKKFPDFLPIYYCQNIYILPLLLAGACSSAGPPRDHSLLQASTCSGAGSLSGATGVYLLHHGPPWAAGGQPTSPWSSSRAAGENSLLWLPEHLLLPLSSLTLVSAELFLSHCLTPLS